MGTKFRNTDSIVDVGDDILLRKLVTDNVLSTQRSGPARQRTDDLETVGLIDVRDFPY